MADTAYIKEMIIMEKGKPTKLVPILVSKDEGKTLASVYLGTNQAGLTSAETTKVLLATESYDIGGNFASNKFTVTVPGYYHIDWSAYLLSDGGTLTGGGSYLYKDGAAVGYGAYGAAFGGGLICPGSIDIYAAAGAYFELYANGTTSSSTWKIVGVAPGTFMNVRLIST